ncbi:hypothetical protein [uncultured Roseibium sp.]|uniref:hypothetical protein n=1 Tax=uncultured Roseibium sp. TaxID=1936171 RepID=UPI0032173A8F
MWRTHLIILGLLALLAGAVLLLDRYLLLPRGGPLPVDMRGAFITVYLLWLLAQIVVSTSLLLVLKEPKPVWVHVLGAPIAIVLVIAGFFIYSGVDSYLAGNARQARLDARAGYADAVRLVEWKLEPADGTPERARLILVFKAFGRFAAHIEGRSAEDMQTFAGELKPQVQVEAGERLDVVLPLTHYREQPAEDVSVTLYLFKDETGSAPENIHMTYRTGLTVRDDGKYFYAPLPPEGVRASQ